LEIGNSIKTFGTPLISMNTPENGIDLSMSTYTGTFILTFCTTIQAWHVSRLNFWHSPIASTSMRSFWLYSGERQLSTW
jgi:hypothetical protein